MTRCELNRANTHVPRREVVEASGLPASSRLGERVELPREELGFITKEAVAALVEPSALNCGNLIDIYQKREDDFEAIKPLEVTYQLSNGQKVNETIFVDCLVPPSTPRVCVAVDSVHAMHKAIAVLVRKVDNLGMTLRSCREHYYKELFSLRHSRPPEKEHEVYWFDPKAYQDQVTKSQMLDRLNGTREAELLKELQQKDEELASLRNAAFEQSNFSKVSAEMPLEQLFLRLAVANEFRKMAFLKHLEIFLQEEKQKSRRPHVQILNPEKSEAQDRAVRGLRVQLDASEQQIAELKKQVKEAEDAAAKALTETMAIAEAQEAPVVRFHEATEAAMRLSRRRFGIQANKKEEEESKKLAESDLQEQISDLERSAQAWESEAQQKNQQLLEMRKANEDLTQDLQKATHELALSRAEVMRLTNRIKSLELHMRHGHGHEGSSPSPFGSTDAGGDSHSARGSPLMRQRHRSLTDTTAMQDSRSHGLALTSTIDSSLGQALELAGWKGLRSTTRRGVILEQKRKDRLQKESLERAAEKLRSERLYAGVQVRRTPSKHRRQSDPHVSLARETPSPHRLVVPQSAASARPVDPFTDQVIAALAAEADDLLSEGDVMNGDREDHQDFLDDDLERREIIDSTTQVHDTMTPELLPTCPRSWSQSPDKLEGMCHRSPESSPSYVPETSRSRPPEPSRSHLPINVSQNIRLETDLEASKFTSQSQAFSSSPTPSPEQSRQGSKCTSILDREYCTPIVEQREASVQTQIGVTSHPHSWCLVGSSPLEREIVFGRSRLDLLKLSLNYAFNCLFSLGIAHKSIFQELLRALDDDDENRGHEHDSPKRRQAQKPARARPNNIERMNAVRKMNLHHTQLQDEKRLWFEYLHKEQRQPLEQLRSYGAPIGATAPIALSTSRVPTPGVEGSYARKEIHRMSVDYEYEPPSQKGSEVFRDFEAGAKSHFARHVSNEDGDGQFAAQAIFMQEELQRMKVPEVSPSRLLFTPLGTPRPSPFPSGNYDAVTAEMQSPRGSFGPVMSDMMTKPGSIRSVIPEAVARTGSSSTFSSFSEEPPEVLQQRAPPRVVPSPDLYKGPVTKAVWHHAEKVTKNAIVRPRTPNSPSGAVPFRGRWSPETSQGGCSNRNAATILAGFARPPSAPKPANHKAQTDELQQKTNAMGRRLSRR